MTRYDYDIRRGMRRHENDGSAAWRVILVCLLILALFSTIAGVLVKQVNDAATAHPTSIAKVRTDDGNTIKVYRVTVGGHEYLVNDRGGMCPCTGSSEVTTVG